ncbi:MAG TPA: NUDIX domain-containing protein [Flavipsychrobacter sp.]|nr:NUDIX domain-containing protein [Flavipsychrobacter sp.]
MKNNESAGILLYRIDNDRLEVLLVHPGGPYHVKKDLGNWTIPKGLIDENEDHLVAAKREFFEETGHQLATTQFIELHPVKQKAGKTVYAWAAEGDLDASGITSNVFKMEYPYKSGKWIDVAEIDRAEWFDVETAKQKINAAQAAFIDELVNILDR